MAWGAGLSSFDRETGEMLERVHLQPELAAFESLIRERASRGFERSRTSASPARPRVERDSGTGELTVLAEFITGSRLSDLLEATADAAIVPGVDVALGYLLDGLPALTPAAHDRRHHARPHRRLPHRPHAGRTDRVSRPGLWLGSRAPRPLASAAVDRVSASRLPPGDGSVHLDAAADIAQVALGAVALVLGRNLRPDEYPEALPSLLMEVIEVAQIRGSAAFATGLQRFLQRSLPLPGRRPHASADEALGDVRQLVRRDIGVDVCRQAVVDFAAQMDAAFGTARG